MLWSGWPLWATFLGWAVGGFGMGLLFNPTTVATMSYATPGTEGRVSSQLTLADAFGFSLMGGIGGGDGRPRRPHLAHRSAGALGINFAIALVPRPRRRVARQNRHIHASMSPRELEFGRTTLRRADWPA